MSLTDNGFESRLVKVALQVPAAGMHVNAKRRPSRRLFCLVQGQW